MKNIIDKKISFEPDIKQNYKFLLQKIKDKSVLIIGGANYRFKLY